MTKINNYENILQPMASYYEGPKSAQCSFIFYSFTLREFTISSLEKRLAISVSQRQGVNGSTNSQRLEMLESYEQAALLCDFIL